MGSILSDDAAYGLQPSAGMQSFSGYPSADGFTAFKITDLASEQDTPPPTGLKEEVVLLSWLITLMRTREGAQFAFEWAYHGQEEGHLEQKSLAMSEVVQQPPGNVEEMLAAVSRRVGDEQAKEATSGPVSLLLSTGSLIRTSAEPNSEVCSVGQPRKQLQY